MSTQPTVYVVDDDPGALRSLCWLLEQADLPVRAFQSSEEFLAACDPASSGCLLLDMRMPGLGGLDVQQRLNERGIELPIVFITAFGDVPTCAEAFRAGAFDFLEKPVEDDLLLAYVQRAMARDVQRRRESPGSRFRADRSRLTPREKEVMDHLLAGRSLKEIAGMTKVSVQTAWRHRNNIFRKMAVENEVELVRLATQASYEIPELPTA